MDTTTLPGTNLRLPPMALGTMHFGTRVAEDDALALLDHAHGTGARFWDTANNYAFWAPGGTGDESERCLGRWFARSGRRDEVVLATKVGARPAAAEAGLDDVLGLAPEAVTAQTEASLRRLGTDHVDLLYAHVDDTDVPLAETVGALQELVDRGLARAYGASNLTASRLREALEVAGDRPHAALQSRFTLIEPHPEGDLGPHVLLGDDVAETCEAAGVARVGYSPLLEGAYTRPDRDLPPAYGTRAEREGAFDILEDAAVSLGLDAGQAVLAWMVARERPVIPVVGVSSMEQLDSARTAVTTPVPPDVVARLEAVRRP